MNRNQVRLHAPAQHAFAHVFDQRIPRTPVKDHPDDVSLLREHHSFCLANADMAQRSSLFKQQDSWQREARETLQLADVIVCQRALSAQGFPGKVFAVTDELLEPVQGSTWRWLPKPIDHVSDRMPPSALTACRTIRDKGLPLTSPHIYYPEEDTRLPDTFKRSIVESSKIAARHLTVAFTVTAATAALAAVSVLAVPVIAAAAIPTAILSTSDPVLCFVPRVPHQPGDHWIHLMVCRWV